MTVVQQTGAVAGLAGIVGLAVLAALYVAQARDVKRLREWAGTAPERAEQRAAAVPRPAARRVASRSVRIARPVVIALGGLLVLGGATVYGAAALLGGGGDHRGEARATPHAPASHHEPKRTTSAAVDPGAVTVAVLNATTVPGLAAALREQLATAGFQKGPINDFSDPGLGESVVQYASGHEAEAKAVGRALGVGRSEPITPESLARAPGATVIVIAGADQGGAAP